MSILATGGAGYIGPHVVSLAGKRSGMSIFGDDFAQAHIDVLKYLDSNKKYFRMGSQI